MFEVLRIYGQAQLHRVHHFYTKSDKGQRNDPSRYFSKPNEIETRKFGTQGFISLWQQLVRFFGLFIVYVSSEGAM